MPVLTRAGPSLFLSADNYIQCGFAVSVAVLLLLLGLGVALAGANAIGQDTAKPEHGRCPLCGEALAVGGWCSRCQLARDAAEQVFRAHRLEEARTPCGVLVFLALVALALAIFGTVWALTYQ
jgi:hypothetical protein